MLSRAVKTAANVNASTAKTEPSFTTIPQQSPSFMFQDYGSGVLDHLSMPDLLNNRLVNRPWQTLIESYIKKSPEKNCLTISLPPRKKPSGDHGPTILDLPPTSAPQQVFKTTPVSLKNLLSLGKYFKIFACIAHPEIVNYRGLLECLYDDLENLNSAAPEQKKDLELVIAVGASEMNNSPMADSYLQKINHSEFITSLVINHHIKGLNTLCLPNLRILYSHNVRNLQFFDELANLLSCEIFNYLNYDYDIEFVLNFLKDKALNLKELKLDVRRPGTDEVDFRVFARLSKLTKLTLACRKIIFGDLDAEKFPSLEYLDLTCDDVSGVLNTPLTSLKVLKLRSMPARATPFCPAYSDYPLRNLVINLPQIFPNLTTLAVSFPDILNLLSSEIFTRIPSLTTIIIDAHVRMVADVINEPLLLRLSQRHKETLRALLAKKPSLKILIEYERHPYTDLRAGIGMQLFNDFID